MHGSRLKHSCPSVPYRTACSQAASAAAQHGGDMVEHIQAAQYAARGLDKPMRLARVGKHAWALPACCVEIIRVFAHHASSSTTSFSGFATACCGSCSFAVLCSLGILPWKGPCQHFIERGCSFTRFLLLELCRVQSSQPSCPKQEDRRSSKSDHAVRPSSTPIAWIEPFLYQVES